MVNMNYRAYEDALNAISFLQETLYNTKAGQDDSRQAVLVRQGNELIQEAFALYGGAPEATQTITELQTLPYKTADLETSLHQTHSALISSQTNLHTETAGHQQTRSSLDTALTRLQKEIAGHRQTEKHVNQLEHLLRQEIASHQATQIQADEYEILLREIHHRIKNNMTMAISLIELQMGKLHAPEDRILFQELEHRIYTMALIHEKLYQSQDASSINFEMFIRDLAQTLLSSYELQPAQVTLDINIEDVYLKLDKAIPCGLILNELLTNALKYAFPDGRQGTISVIGQKQPEVYVLTVHDDGIGLPADFDSRAVTTLGMRLVTLLAQTMGTLRIERAHGTAFIIDISMDMMNPNKDAS